MELHDAQGVQLQAPSDLTYLHGGYGELLPALERALEGKSPGESIRLQLEPEHAFGDYDAQLLRVEPAERYGEGVEVGMEIEEDSRFYTVTDIAAGKVDRDRRFRLGGLVVEGSVRRGGADGLVSFALTDQANVVQVRYRGLLPDLFREGQGIVAQGVLGDDGVFVANEVLAKHDETYMPPEVAEALKQAGMWRHNEAVAGEAPGGAQP